MMTKDEQNTIRTVFQKFVESDEAEQGWSDIDEQISMLEWLDDQQLTVEAAVLLQLQASGQPRCNQNHPVSECFVPVIIDAANIIIDLYSKTGTLHPKNRYILSYYLALSQINFIVY